MNRAPALQPAPGFDWGRVTWGHPDSVTSALCSYCSAGIGEEVPLLLFRDDGAAARFCDSCQEMWWGMKVYRSIEREVKRRFQS